MVATAHQQRLGKEIMVVMQAIQLTEQLPRVAEVAAHQQQDKVEIIKLLDITAALEQHHLYQVPL
jgi:hypothetical protein